MSKPGAVQIATTGQFEGKVFSLKGGPAKDANHAKIGVSTSSSRHFVIFADMNQQGTLSGPNCGSSQNGRGGLFYVLDEATLFESVSELIMGESAPTTVTR